MERRRFGVIGINALLLLLLCALRVDANRVAFWMFGWDAFRYEVLSLQCNIGFCSGEYFDENSTII